MNLHFQELIIFTNLLKKYILKQKNQKSKNGYYLKTHTHSTGRKQTSFLVIR